MCGIKAAWDCDGSSLDIVLERKQVKRLECGIRIDSRRSMTNYNEAAFWNTWNTEQGIPMKQHKAVMLNYAPRAASMAERLEKTANEMVQQGYESVIFSVTNSTKAIAVFSIGKND